MVFFTLCSKSRSRDLCHYGNMISNNKSFENLEVTPPYPVSRRITSDSTPLLVEHSGYSQTFVPAGRLPHLQPENA